MPVERPILHQVGVMLESVGFKPSQRSQCPLLSRYGYRYSLYPSYIVQKVERVFSATKKTIRRDRWSLQANTTDAIECFRSWFKAGCSLKERRCQITNVMTRY